MANEEQQLQSLSSPLRQLGDTKLTPCPPPSVSKGEQIAISPQEWPNCALEAAMPLDLREDFYRGRLPNLRELSCSLAAKASSLLRRFAESVFLCVSRTRGGAGTAP